MSSYLASEESYVICTNAVVSESRLLICNNDRRIATDVHWGSKGKVLLVEVDTTIMEDFTCATKWKSIIGHAGFWGGLAGGLLSIAGISALIPGPGWVVAAVCVGIIAGTAIIAGLITANQHPCKCNEILANSMWSFVHPTVTFNEQYAITHFSVLQCSEGGTLLPFMSKELADNAAKNIRNWNLIDITQNGILSAAGGFFSGKDPVSFVVFSFLGELFLNNIENSIYDWGLNIQSNIMHSAYGDDNTIYNNMTQQVDTDETGVVENAYGTLDNVKKIHNNNIDIKDNTTKANIASKQSETLNTALNNKGNYPAASNPEFYNIMNNADYADIYTNRSGNHRGMNNPQRNEEARNRADSKKTEHRNKANKNRRERASNILGLISTILSLVDPFINNWLNEEARLVAAEAALQDATNSISINSVNH